MLADILHQWQSAGLPVERLMITVFIAIRLLPMVVWSPAFGGKFVPARVKIPAALAFAVPLGGAVVCSVDPGPFLLDEAHLIITVAKELIIGFMIAFAVSIVFWAIQSAGRFLDTVRGETLAQVLAPGAGGRTSSIGHIYMFISILIFFSFRGHMMLLYAVKDSYHWFPLYHSGSVNGTKAVEVWSLYILRQTVRLFDIALKGSAPVVVTVWMTDILLGIANRVTPALRVFHLGLPLKMWIGILIVAATLLLSAHSFQKVMVDMIGGVAEMLKNGLYT